MNPNRPTPRCIVIKMAKVKDKERIVKAAREKQRVSYKGTPVRLSADFSAEICSPECHDIFKVFKQKSLQCRIHYPARLSFRIEGEINNFSDKKKLKELGTTEPTIK